MYSSYIYILYNYIYIYISEKIEIIFFIIFLFSSEAALLDLEKEHLQLAIIYRRITCCIGESTPLQFAVELPPSQPIFTRVLIGSAFPSVATDDVTLFLPTTHPPLRLWIPLPHNFSWSLLCQDSLFSLVSFLSPYFFDHSPSLP